MRFYLPVKPYSLIDAVNRAAAATGSMRYAQLAAHADYNGHRYDVYTTVRGWACSYMWAGIRKIASGDFLTCVWAAKREYDRGGKGSSVKVDLAHVQASEKEMQEMIGILQSLGFVDEQTAEQMTAEWRDARYDEVHHALRGWPYGNVEYLLSSATVEEYLDKMKTRPS